MKHDDYTNQSGAKQINKDSILVCFNNELVRCWEEETGSWMGLSIMVFLWLFSGCPMDENIRDPALRFSSSGSSRNISTIQGERSGDVVTKRESQNGMVPPPKKTFFFVPCW